jgi:hypothetical protein
MPKIFVPAINSTEWETQLYHPIPIFKNTGWLKLAAVYRERFQMQSEKAWETASVASPGWMGPFSQQSEDPRWRFGNTVRIANVESQSCL